jgi:hypothetical protein
VPPRGSFGFERADYKQVRSFGISRGCEVGNREFRMAGGAGDLYFTSTRSKSGAHVW